MKPQSIAAIAAMVLISAAPVSAVREGVPSAPVVRGVQLAGLFGESDEERAARQHENDQDAQISDLTQRIHDLERALQQSTGQNEQQSERIRELSRRIDQQQKDFDYKLCTLAAQQLGAGTSSNAGSNALPCDTSASAPAQALPGAAPQPPVPAPPPSSGGALGTLPQSSASGTPTRSQYDEAMNLLARARYDEARAAFQSFVDANPKDPMAPQAAFWVGNIAFVQKDYSAASQAFAQVVKNYPTSAQGPESTLKLGQSLIALGKKKEGCVFLGAIKTKYKHAPDTILAQAAAVRAASCK